jgi:hypothetical protein
VRVKVSYCLQNFENLQRFFTGEPWPWRPWTCCPQEGLGGKLSFKKMSAGGRLCTLPENPHFWVPTIKVRPPDGSKAPELSSRVRCIWESGIGGQREGGTALGGDAARNYVDAREESAVVGQHCQCQGHSSKRRVLGAAVYRHSSGSATVSTHCCFPPRSPRLSNTSSSEFDVRTRARSAQQMNFWF